MRSSGASESRLAYLVDLWVQLRRDAECAEPELRRRDRALLPPGAARLDRVALLRRWLDCLRKAGYRFPGGAVAVAFRLELLGLTLGGLAVGWGVAAALFRYDGAQPVNVVHVLAGLVGVQVLLLLLLGVAFLPRQWTRFIPGLSPVQDLLKWMSPGQITRMLARRLPEPLSGPLGGGLAPGSMSDYWPRRVLKWAAVGSAQLFGVAFNVGALAASLYLIVFSDLAFSWSTTLSPEVGRVHQLTGWVAKPWAAVLPEAVPSPELIQSTLYYRQTGTPSNADPVHWGGWWPFLVVSVAVYGLTPRLLLLALAGWRFHCAVNQALVRTAGASEVLDRLTHENVSTQATQPEPGADRWPKVPPDGESVIPAGRYLVVNWGGLPVDAARVGRELSRRWGCEVAELQPAGGAAATEVDARTLKRIVDLPPECGVVLLAKAWEPPMLEVVDFLGEVRNRLGRGRHLIVVLVGLEGHGGLGVPEAREVIVWRRQLGGLEDPDLRVVAWTEEKP